MPAGNIGPFEEMLQRWRVIGTVPDWIRPRFEPQTSRSRDKRVAARPTVKFLNVLDSGTPIISKKLR